jgi:hypothetical protein
MKKFAFLVPVAAAAAALSGEASANVPPQTSPETKSMDSIESVGTSAAQKNTEISYAKGDELHSLMMRRTETGQVFAQHMSHSSHSSHGSHQSHRSGS